MKRVMHYIIGYLFVGMLLASCSHSKQMFVSDAYLNPLTDSILKVENQQDYVITTDDKISISVWNHDDLSIGSVFGIYNSNEVYGKWVYVDAEGFVKVPQLGKVKLGGLTLDQANERMAKLLAKYIKDPIVVVKVLNNSVSVLGEVRTPGTFLLEEEYNSLWEIVSKAEGFEYYADLENVKLIRGGAHNPRIYLLDLTEENSYMYHNFKILPDDVIYIPANKGKDVDKKSGRIIPITAIITTAVLVITQIN